MAGASLEDVYLLRPLNEQPPTTEDKRHSKELEEFLRASGLYESLDEAYLREEVLGLFYQLVQNWVKGVCRKKNFSVEDARAHVYTFGSYRLGVHGPGADMDTLVVGPRYVLRETDFFGGEKHCLQYLLTQTPDVTDIQPVPDAFVPMIGIKYKGVQIDILYASLAMHTLPETLDLSNHAVLRGCDEPTVRALNGCRVTDTLLRLVPRQDVFRLALRAAKHWASLRGISSNVTGYLGGVNLAIMVAKICQLYPRAEASTVLLKFFILLKAWPWPRAIHLRVPEEHSLGLPVWDPRPGTRDSLALMPVITPAYPAMNSLYNVQRSTLEVMTAEFAGAAEVCTSFLRCRGGQAMDWVRLFAPVPFFSQHTFYIQLEVSADSEADLVLWDGWVSSRIRRLVRNLEDHVRVRPYPKPQRPPQPSPPPALPSKDPDAKPLAALEAPPSSAPDATAAVATAESRPRLMYYIGIDKRVAPAVTAQQLLPNGQLAQLPPHAAGAAAGAPAGKVDLKQPCMIFVNEVTAWPAKRSGMELRVNVLRRAQLPQWLLLEAAQQQQQQVQQQEAPAALPAAQTELQQQQQQGTKRVASAEGSLSALSADTAAATFGGGKPPRAAEGRQPLQQPLAKRPRTDQVLPRALPNRDGSFPPHSRSPSPLLLPPDGQALASSTTATTTTAENGAPVEPQSATTAAAAAADAGQQPQPEQVGSVAEASREQQLQQAACVADERAALQESQLHNTGRDMGDWLGVDHGLCLAAREDAAGASG
ncbi:hypothetical protein Agub_g7072 [Astrephomene gubernaculifera]|uniref:polynucleotide adenylyltransferase n=1 Tax=Astrephomene gubernaculifera TaxID=47775 RepID=A0AAD3DPH9_9CHLO|nr:hypothetical protein Agub_g7072 [Astrephomene gubernaculifera]